MVQKNFRILIFEGETLIAHDIKQVLNKIGYTNSKIAKDFNTAKSILEAYEPDLILLDVVINGSFDGFKLAEDCMNNNISFLYITSYDDDQTIENATKFRPIAYIIQPFRESELKAAIQIDRAKKRNEKQVIIKDGLKKYKIKLDNILFIEAHTPYVKINLINSIITVRNSLANVMEEFNDKEIIRVHRSYAVNVAKITIFKANMIEVNGVEIPISRTYAKLHRAILREDELH